MSYVGPVLLSESLQKLLHATLRRQAAQQLTCSLSGPWLLIKLTLKGVVFSFLFFSVWMRFFGDLCCRPKRRKTSSKELSEWPPILTPPQKCSALLNDQNQAMLPPGAHIWPSAFRLWHLNTLLVITQNACEKFATHCIGCCGVMC